MKIEIFISQPMLGIKPEKVDEMRESISKYALNKKYVTGYDVIIVSAYYDEKHAGESDSWYLLNAISKMMKCDLVLFAPNWTDDKMCKIEMHICQLYDIKYEILKESQIKSKMINPVVWSLNKNGFLNKSELFPIEYNEIEDCKKKYSSEVSIMFYDPATGECIDRTPILYNNSNPIVYIAIPYVYINGKEYGKMEAYEDMKIVASKFFEADIKYTVCNNMEQTKTQEWYINKSICKFINNCDVLMLHYNYKMDKCSIILEYLARELNKPILYFNENEFVYIKGI